MMDKDIFLRQFEHLAQRPEGTQKLRELILQLAMQGMLVEQDSNDTPSSILFKEIIAAKNNLLETKQRKKLRELPPLSDAEIPFQLPTTWIWERLGTLTNYGETTKIEPNDVANDATWVVELEDIEKQTSKILKRVSFKDRRFKSSKNMFFKGDVLYGKLRPYLDKVIVADQDGVCTTEIIPVSPYAGIETSYLRLVLKSPFFISYANASTHGMNLPRLGTEKARLSAFPLPPINEQKRIVAKVDELMALCDEFETSQERHTALKRNCVASTLHHLTEAPDERELNANWSIAERNFSTWFNDQQTVKNLRASIRQLAVQGRLVSQDTSDDPASSLLNSIRANKKKLIETGVIKKEKPLPNIDAADQPCLLPNGWQWVRLGELFKRSEYGTSEKAYAENKNGVPVYTMGHIQDGRLNDKAFTYLDRDSDSLPKLYLKNKDLLFNRTNSYDLVGKSALYLGEDDQSTFASYLIRASLLHDWIDCFYVNLFMNSPLCRKTQIEPQITKQTNQANFNGTKLKNILFPLPPLAEQNRIVAKVDELMALCDQLEAQISAHEKLTQGLTDSLIHHLTAA